MSAARGENMPQKTPPIVIDTAAAAADMVAAVATFSPAVDEPTEITKLTQFSIVPPRKQRVSDATTDLLNRKLDRSNVEVRQQGNRELSYIPSHYAIRNANEVFGYGGWSTKILGTTRTPFTAGNKDQMFYETQVEVTVYLDNGETRSFEDIGTGIAESLVGWQLDKAAKGAVSDAEKRALRHWGDQFGLGLYDKDSNQDYAGSNAQAATVNTSQGVQQAPTPLRPVQQAAQARPPISQDEATDPGSRTIPCEEPGCEGFVSGFKPSNGAYLPVSRMSELSAQKCNGQFCSTHYRARLPRPARAG